MEWLLSHLDIKDYPEKSVTDSGILIYWTLTWDTPVQKTSKKADVLGSSLQFQADGVPTQYEFVQKGSALAEFS